MQKWIYIIILLTGYSIKSYTQETINLNIPVEQNWMFDNEHPSTLPCGIDICTVRFFG